MSANIHGEMTSSRKSNSSDFTVPRIVTLGGDHTTTLSALRSTNDHWGPVSVIHFDSHIGRSALALRYATADKLQTHGIQKYWAEGFRIMRKHIR